MGINTLPEQQSGLRNIQDLYDLINGKTTTTSGGTVTQSGGTSTQTTSEGISQDSMNEMLKSALEGTAGLASVATGQRVAGGYNSATNRLLVNDLLTRTASQIAQQNKNKTVVTTTPDIVKTTSPTTVQVGGVDAGGLGKSAALIYGGQVASNIAQGKNILDGISGLTNSIGSFIKGQSGPSDPFITGIDDSHLGAMTSENANMTTADQYASYGAGKGIAETAMEDTGPTAGPDIADFAQMDAPTQQEEEIPEFANGGLVTKKGSTVLGTNQFNRVIDPRTGLIGGGSGFNDAQIAQGGSNGQVVSNPGVNTPSSNSNGSGGTGNNIPTSGGGSHIVSTEGGRDVSVGPVGVGNVRGDLNSLSTLTNAIGTVANNPGVANLGTIGRFLTSDSLSRTGDIIGRAMSGDTTRTDVNDIGRDMTSVGAIARNPNLSDAGKVVDIASSKSPTEAAFKVADAATGNVVSKVKNFGNAVIAGDTQAGINAVASFNPLSRLYNAVAGLFDSSLGEQATVGLSNIKGGDALDNYLSLRGLGPSSVGDNSQVQRDQESARVAAEKAASDKAIADQAAKDAADQEAADQAAAIAATAQSAGTPIASNTVAPAVSGGGGGGGKGYAFKPGPDKGFGPTDQAGLGTMGGGGYGTESDGEGNSGGNDLADGGDVDGPGGPIGDKIHAMLSDGEYVLSADTVQAIGVHNLDALQAKYHTPAAVQKLKSYAKR